MIIQETPARPRSGTADEPPYPFCLSAKSERSLRDLARRFAAHLGAQAEQTLAEVCYTADTGRSQFPHRLALIADSREELRDGLAAFVEGKKSATVHGQVAGNVRPKLAFLFTGQGSQYRGMGRQLYRTEPVFRVVPDMCLQQHLFFFAGFATAIDKLSDHVTDFGYVGVSRDMIPIGQHKTRKRRRMLGEEIF